MDVWFYCVFIVSRVLGSVSMIWGGFSEFLVVFFEGFDGFFQGLWCFFFLGFSVGLG